MMMRYKGSASACRSSASSRPFVNRGNVLDLAVGVIIGAAFAKIVTALTDDFITPILSVLTGGLDFANMFVPLRAIPGGAPHTLAAMKAANIPVFAWGHFVTEVINFLILAWIIFLIVKAANRVLRRSEEAATPADILLLREIRDELKARPKI